MIEVFLVDDEQRALDTLSNALHAFFDNVKVVGTATNVSDAYAGISNCRPHLVFLDVNMGPESGFQLLEKFSKIDFHVAFVTAHEEYALKAIKFSALDYIIKPAGVSELKALLTKVEQQPAGKPENQKVQQMFGNILTADKNEHKITISLHDGYEFVRVSDIMYITAQGGYSKLELKNDIQLTASKNLKFFEAILEGYGFFRIHNSTLINLRYIKRMTKAAGGTVIMENQQEFSISKARKDELLQVLSLS